MQVLFIQLTCMAPSKPELLQGPEHFGKTSNKDGASSQLDYSLSSILMSLVVEAASS